MGQSQPEMDAVVDSLVKRLDTDGSQRTIDHVKWQVIKGHGEKRLFWNFQRAHGNLKFRILLAGQGYMPMMEAGSRSAEPELRAAVPILMGNGAETEAFETARRAILMRFLTDSSPLVKERALWQLRFIPRPKSFNPISRIRPLLRDSDVWVRVQAAVAFADWSNSGGVPVLVSEIVDRELKHSQDRITLRSEADNVLRRFAKASTPLVITRLTSQDPHVRGRALRMLNLLRPTNLMELAAPLARDRSEWVRGEAYGAIGAQRRNVSIPLLVAGFQDSSENVRQRVEDTLRNGGWPSFSKYWLEGCEALKKARPKAWIPLPSQMASPGSDG